MVAKIESKINLNTGSKRARRFNQRKTADKRRIKDIMYSLAILNWVRP